MEVCCRNEKEDEKQNCVRRVRRFVEGRREREKKIVIRQKLKKRRSRRGR